MALDANSQKNWSVLGIDAAWTSTQPSGVALVTNIAGALSLTAVSSSYGDFNNSSGGPLVIATKHVGERPDIKQLLQTTEALGGILPSIIAVDMPLSHKPIMYRRVSDNLISTEYGGRWASTHSPTAERPGLVSDQFTEDCSRRGYRLLTAPDQKKGLIEVYPHTALIELLKAEKRLPYKIGRISKYWPEADKITRRKNLIKTWAKIIDALEEKILGVKAKMLLPDPNSETWKFKVFEDGLDSIICCLVGVNYMEKEGSTLWR